MTENDSAQLANVSAVKQGNVYFDGKCVSHTVFLADGSRKTLGVIVPSTLTFGTAAPEGMEIVAGTCRVRLAGETEWTTYGPGDTFSIPGDSNFDIEAVETLHYVCSYG